MSTDISSNLQVKLNELKPYNCQLVAVSKTKPFEDIEKAYQAGHRDFGENKVQELVEKHSNLPEDIKWHMIGHLQRNKVKYIADFVHLIHGVDTSKLLQEINKQGKKVGRVIPCLLQVHIARESTKFGFDEAELWELFRSPSWAELDHVAIKGLMGMATNTSDLSQVKQEFRTLKKLFDTIDHEVKAQNIAMDTLSMGMSGDYRIAMEEGSNMVRIGSAIFGERSYPQK